MRFTILPHVHAKPPSVCYTHEIYLFCLWSESKSLYNGRGVIVLLYTLYFSHFLVISSYNTLTSLVESIEIYISLINSLVCRSFRVFGFRNIQYGKTNLRSVFELFRVV